MSLGQVRITKEEFDRGTAPDIGNHVLVEVFFSVEGLETKSGVIVGFNTDAVYAEGTESHAADLTEVYGRVVRTPKKLAYSRKDPNGMSWKTVVEIEEGDYVWFNFFISRNCSEVIIGERLLKAIPYEDLFVARKGSMTGEIIPLNGYCLLEPIPEKAISVFDVLSEHKVDKTKAIVRYIGKPIEEYQTPMNGDMDDVQPGDLAYFTKGFIPYMLERKQFLAAFDGDVQYYVTQRRRLSLVLRNN